MNIILFNQNDIENVFKEAETSLLNPIYINHIKYLNFDYKTFDTNNQVLLKDISGNDIVYCIWSGDSFESLKPKYIGHTAGKTARQRIRNHLTKKHKRTGAQLGRVIEALKGKNCIGLSFVKIEPAYMRKSLEEWIIAQHSIKLEWNQVGRKLNN